MKLIKAAVVIVASLSITGCIEIISEKILFSNEYLYCENMDNQFFSYERSDGYLGFYKLVPDKNKCGHYKLFNSKWLKGESDIYDTVIIFRIEIDNGYVYIIQKYNPFAEKYKYTNYFAVDATYEDSQREQVDFKFIFSGVGKEIAEKIIELYKDEISSGNPFIVRQKDEEFEEINTFNGTYLVVKSGNQLLDLANGFEAKAQEISKMYDITGCCGRRFQLLVIDEEQYKLSLNIE